MVRQTSVAVVLSWPSKSTGKDIHILWLWGSALAGLRPAKELRYGAIEWELVKFANSINPRCSKAKIVGLQDTRFETLYTDKENKRTLVLVIEINHMHVQANMKKVLKSMLRFVGNNSAVLINTSSPFLFSILCYWKSHQFRALSFICVTYRVELNFCGSSILRIGDFLGFTETNFCDWERLVFLTGN